MSTTTCRRCQAVIRFVRLDTGKPIPVEPHPFPDRGNVAAQWQGSTLVGYVLSMAKPLQEGYSRYEPHFAACKPDEPLITASQRPQSLFD